MKIRNNEKGMSLLAVLAVMFIFALMLLAAAPGIQMEVQREKELESIRRGEEIADAIKEYVDYYQGAKLPESIDDLLEGIPAGTKKRMILRESAAVDPLSDDGEWKLVSPTGSTFQSFARRVQQYNNGLLPSTPDRFLNRYAVSLASVSLKSVEEDPKEPDASDGDNVTGDIQFIGVTSSSRRRSVITYYGQENHSKWVFTPMFRGGQSGPQQRVGNIITSRD
ncbi:MAG: prepilin-type N-terminal cleavage/methylation domain-containing protein [Pyrinomonadaceae bacterium]